MSPPTPLAFLDALNPELLPNEYLELRVRPANGGVFSCWLSSPGELVALAARQPRTSHVWYGVSTRLGRHGDASHVSRLGAAWGDVDWKCFAGGEAEALAAIEAFPLRPSCLVASGHGFHPYWYWMEPVLGAVDGERVRRVLRGIQRGLSRKAVRALDAVHDLSRVMRLPDSWNSKVQPAVQVEIVYLDSARRYRVDDFIAADIWAPARPAHKPQHPCQPSLPAQVSRSAGTCLPSWVSDALEHPERHLRQSLSELDFAVLCELLPLLGPDDAEAVWLSSALGARDKVQARADYRERTLHNVALHLSGSVPEKWEGAAWHHVEVR